MVCYSNQNVNDNKIFKGFEDFNFTVIITMQSEIIRKLFWTNTGLVSMYCWVYTAYLRDKIEVDGYTRLAQWCSG